MSETLPKTIDELAQIHNIPNEFLKPERYLFDCLYLPEELHLALVKEVTVNPEKILKKESLIRDIQTSLENNDLTFMGIDHAIFRSHEFIAQIISKMNFGEGSIAIEFTPEIQEQVDRFLSTGKFQEDDNPKNYPKFYRQDQRQTLARNPLEEISGTFFDSYPHLAQIYPILLVARAKQIKVVCFDPMGEEMERTQESENAMSEILQNTGKPVLVVVGGDHALKKNYPSSGTQIESVRKICENNGFRAKTYLFDSYQDIEYSWMENQITETVFHAALVASASKKDIKDNLLGYTGDEIVDQIGTDVYIAVNN